MLVALVLLTTGVLAPNGEPLQAASSDRAATYASLTDDTDQDAPMAIFADRALVEVEDTADRDIVSLGLTAPHPAPSGRGVRLVAHDPAEGLGQARPKRPPRL